MKQRTALGAALACAFALLGSCASPAGLVWEARRPHPSDPPPAGFCRGQCGVEVPRGAGPMPVVVAVVPSEKVTLASGFGDRIFVGTPTALWASFPGQPDFFVQGVCRDPAVEVSAFHCVGRDPFLLRYDTKSGETRAVRWLEPGEWYESSFTRHGSTLFGIVGRRARDGSTERAVVAADVTDLGWPRHVIVPFGHVRGDGLSLYATELHYIGDQGLMRQQLTFEQGENALGEPFPFGTSAYRLIDTSLDVVYAGVWGVEAIRKRFATPDPLEGKVRRIHAVTGGGASNPIGGLAWNGAIYWTEAVADQGTAVWWANAQGTETQKIATRPGVIGGLVATSTELVWAETLRSGRTAIVAIPVDGKSKAQVAE